MVLSLRITFRSISSTGRCWCSTLQTQFPHRFAQIFHERFLSTRLSGHTISTLTDCKVDAMDRPAKRHRTNELGTDGLESLQRSISPPKKRARKPVAIPSPWQLTWIQDLPESENKDAVT